MLISVEVHSIPPLNSTNRPEKKNEKWTNLTVHSGNGYKTLYMKLKYIYMMYWSSTSICSFVHLEVKIGNPNCSEWLITSTTRFLSGFLVGTTIDGQNPAPERMMIISLSIGFTHPRWLAGFFHQQYLSPVSYLPWVRGVSAISFSKDKSWSVH